MPGHNFNHFTGKTKPAIKQKTKKKKPKERNPHANKYSASKKLRCEMIISSSLKSNQTIRGAFMVKDFLGQPLTTGDSVVYLHRTATSAFYIKGKVVDFIATGDLKYLVELYVDSTKGNTSVRVHPSQLIRYDENAIQADPDVGTDESAVQEDADARTKYIQFLKANEERIEAVRTAYEKEYKKQLRHSGLI
jgi:hypothetical protein